MFSCPHGGSFLLAIPCVHACLIVAIPVADPASRGFLQWPSHPSHPRLTRPYLCASCCTSQTSPFLLTFTSDLLSTVEHAPFSNFTVCFLRGCSIASLDLSLVLTLVFAFVTVATWRPWTARRASLSTSPLLRLVCRPSDARLAHTRSCHCRCP